MKKILFAILAAALISGCSTISISREGGRTVAVVENTGWYLFKCLPFASGNPERPNKCDCKFFSDTVTLQSNMMLLDEAVRRSGAESCRDVRTYRTSESVCVILLGRYCFHTSAEMVMPKEESQPDAAADATSGATQDGAQDPEAAQHPREVRPEEPAPSK